MTTPARTVTTKDRFGLVQMYCDELPFTPEVAAATRRVAAFLRADGVDISGEYAMVGDCVTVDIGLRMVGNSVCLPLSRALAAANCADMISKMRAA